MRAWEIGEAFGLEHLRQVEHPDPRPVPGEAVVAMRACSLNYRDLLMVRGHYNPKQPLPLVPLSDGAGEVIAVGDGVSRVAVGDRVIATFAPRWIAGAPRHELIRATRGGPLGGTLVERLCVSSEELVRIPDHLSWAEAATLPCAALTAWSALSVHGDVKPGDVVLSQGTGGVSIFALQLAQLLGARVVLTSSSDDKLERGRALGAWKTINYRETPQWGRSARELTGGVGVDHVIEVGGADTLGQSLRAVRPGGTISVIGVLSGTESRVPLNAILMSNVRVQGILVGHREGLESLCRAVDAHAVRPVVDSTFAFDDAPAAFEHLASGAHFGKVVVEVAV